MCIIIPIILGILFCGIVLLGVWITSRDAKEFCTTCEICHVGQVRVRFHYNEDLESVYPCPECGYIYK